MSSNNSSFEPNQDQEDKQKEKTIFRVLTIIAGVITAVAVPYFTYRGVVATIQMPIQATQTAEARLFSSQPPPSFSSKTETLLLASPTPISIPTETLIPVISSSTPTLAPSETASPTPIPPFIIHITDPGGPESTYPCDKGQNIEYTPLVESIILNIEDGNPGNIVWKVQVGRFTYNGSTDLEKVSGKRVIYSRPVINTPIDYIRVFQNDEQICEIKIHLDGSSQ